MGAGAPSKIYLCVHNYFQDHMIALEYSKNEIDAIIISDSDEEQ